MEPITDTVPAARTRARSRARTPHVLPIRPEPERTVRLAVPYTGEPITVRVDLYDFRSGLDSDTTTIFRTKDGREVVVTLLSGGVPLRVRDLDLSVLIPARQS